MAKLKHHTNRNVTAKAHKNTGLRKRRRERHVSQLGMDPKFLRNLRFTRKHQKAAVANAAAAPAAETAAA